MKTAVQNLIKTLKGKKVLFLENDNGLYHGLDQIEEKFIENNISYKCLFDVSNKQFDEILEAIKQSDAIVFQTQWVYEISGKIKEYMFASTDKKIVIECYISDPTWYYKPNVVHDVYVCKPPLRAWKDDKVDDKDWSFFKLSDKPYWGYKNKFNK